MRVLVTGADGFIGQHLVPTLLEAGHTVAAAHRRGTKLPSEWEGVLDIDSFELADPMSVGAVMQTDAEAIIHLAGVSYSQDAKKNPDEAWHINVGGTKSVLDAVRMARKAGEKGPLVLVTSSADVYAEGHPRPRVETDEIRPLSVYAASKLGAEAAAAHAVHAWGLRVIVVRPFPAAGPAQTNRLLPNWFLKLRAGNTEIEGDPAIVRDYIDVRDMAAGFAALLARGRPGEIYNISAGREIRFGDLFDQVTSALGVTARLVPPRHPRREQQYLVGDSRKLRLETGWEPTITLDQMLADMISHAQAH
jgi:GDP-4-dehydro-6-deoxy-D-mannose reductase